MPVKRVVTLSDPRVADSMKIGVHVMLGCRAEKFAAGYMRFFERDQFNTGNWVEFRTSQGRFRVLAGQRTRGQW